jgi:uncharacterized protein YbjT (DUF2867 family)
MKILVLGATGGTGRLTSPMTQLKATSGPSSTSQASTAARLLAPMSLGSLSTN